MKIHLNSFSGFVVPFFKENFLLYLPAQSKRNLIIASVVLACLTALYTAYHCCFQGQLLNRVSKTNFDQDKKTDHYDQEIPQEIRTQIIRQLQVREPKNGLELLYSMACDPPEDKEYLHQCLGLKDDTDLLRSYYNRYDTTASYNTVLSNILFSIYFDGDSYACVSAKGIYLEGKSPKDKITYIPEAWASSSPENAAESTIIFLTNEKEKNPEERPAKIFIAMHWDKSEIGHVALLVIEPSTEIINQARITMINTNGNSPTFFLDFEEKVIEAAHSVYNSSRTVAIRNEKSIYTTVYSCGPDIIELARSLALEANVQDKVKKGLLRRSAKEDAQARIEHGEAVLKFFKNYTVLKL